MRKAWTRLRTRLLMRLERTILHVPVQLVELVTGISSSVFEDENL